MLIDRLIFIEVLLFYVVSNLAVSQREYTISSHGLSFITCNRGPSNEETREGVLDVVGFGYCVLLQIRR